MRIFLIAVLLGAPAWAVGERVKVNTSAEALRDTICVSMSCVARGTPDATVSMRSVPGGVEVTVKAANGALRLVHVMALDEDGSTSSIELVRASSLVVQAIERRTQVKAPKPARQHRPGRMFARR